jgi:hypothetical protein
MMAGRFRLLAFLRLDVQQHDDEQEQHHHRAGIDENLDRADEVGVEAHKQGGQADKARGERQARR